MSNPTKWHPWFAWRPVRLTYGPVAIVWLMRLERSGGFDHRKNTGQKPKWRWDYRLPCAPTPNTTQEP